MQHIEIKPTGNLRGWLQTKTWLEPPWPSSRPRRYPWKLRGGDVGEFTSATSGKERDSVSHDNSGRKYGVSRICVSVYPIKIATWSSAHCCLHFCCSQVASSSSAPEHNVYVAYININRHICIIYICIRISIQLLTPT